MSASRFSSNRDAWVSMSDMSVASSSRACSPAGAEVLALEHAPLAQHGHDDLLAVLAQVVDPRDGDLHRLAPEPLDAVPGHGEVADRAEDGDHRLVGGDVEGRVDDVAVEEHVQVLVEGDAREQLLGDRVAGGGTGVAVRHAGRELLERHVGQAGEEAGMDRREPLLHVDMRARSIAIGSIERVTSR